MAQGSGIPEIKTILFGVEYKDFFSWRTMWAKYFSIYFARVAGLGIGFEAAFIHISAILAEQLMTVDFFKEVRKRQYKCTLIASISLSFVIAFGCPIGGVI